MARSLVSTPLLDLPEELILHVVSLFKAIRSDYPQSEAFEDKVGEKCRQRENRQRQYDLHALCITSKALNRISTPILYSSFLGSTTLKGFEPLRLFFKTITSHEELGNHIEYIENRLSDYLGNDLLRDMDLHDMDNVVVEYFVMLAIVIRRSPNLLHLCVVSIESLQVSLWRHLLEQDGNESSGSVCFMFPKLRTLALQTNASRAYLDATNHTWPSQLFCELAGLGSLEKMHASGLIFGRSVASWRPFANLRHMELTEVESEMTDIDLVLSQCQDLQHFVCHWVFLSIPEASVAILPNLAQHKDTLQTLELTASRSQRSMDREPTFDYASISCLVVLKEAKICNFGAEERDVITVDDAWASPLLSSPLPLSLERLEVVYPKLWPIRGAYHFDIMGELCRLARDALDRIPNLKELVLHVDHDDMWDVWDNSFSREPSQCWGVVLEKLFKPRGIRFSLGHDTYVAS